MAQSVAEMVAAAIAGSDSSVAAEVTVAEGSSMKTKSASGA